jgi:hypothetical protein
MIHQTRKKRNDPPSLLDPEFTSGFTLTTLNASPASQCGAASAGGDGLGLTVYENVFINPQSITKTESLRAFLRIPPVFIFAMLIDPLPYFRRNIAQLVIDNSKPDSVGKIHNLYGKRTDPIG